MEYKKYKEKMQKKWDKKKAQIKQEHRLKSPIQKIIEGGIIGIIILFLSAHLFTIHSKLLFHINPDKLVQELVYKFNASLFGEVLIVSTIGAIAYSLITALILTIFVRYRKVFLFAVATFAILDAIGVFLYYNVTTEQKVFIILVSIYYAFYTASIIISLGLYRNLDYNSEAIEETLRENIDDSIKDMDTDKLRGIIQEVYSENNKIIHNPVEFKEEYSDELVSEEFKDLPSLDKKVLYLLTKRDPKMTQQEAAKHLGISQPQVSRIYNKYKTE